MNEDDVLDFVSQADAYHISPSNLFASVLPDSISPEIFRVGDFNNDGRQDFLLRAHKDLSELPQWSIYYTQGDSISSQLIYPPPGRAFYSPEFGDIDNDGDVDIVLLHATAAAPITILRNQENEFTIEIPQFNVPFSINTFKLLDFDNNGTLDILAHKKLDGLAIFKSEDGIATPPEVIVNSVDDLFFFDIVDLDNDGLLDAVFMLERDTKIFLAYAKNMGGYNLGPVVELGECGEYNKFFVD